jgi:hypothetical protein
LQSANTPHCSISTSGGRWPRPGGSRRRGGELTRHFFSRSTGAPLVGMSKASPPLPQLPLLRRRALPPLDDEDSIPQGVTRKRAADQNTKPHSLRYGPAWFPRRGSGWNLDSLGFAKEQTALQPVCFNGEASTCPLLLTLFLIR